MGARSPKSRCLQCHSHRRVLCGPRYSLICGSINLISPLSSYGLLCLCLLLFCLLQGYLSSDLEPVLMQDKSYSEIHTLIVSAKTFIPSKAYSEVLHGHIFGVNTIQPLIVIFTSSGSDLVSKDFAWWRPKHSFLYLKCPKKKIVFLPSIR